MLKFVGSKDFKVELRKRIDVFFQSTERRQRDCPQMYVKTAILLGAFTTSYVLLVFVAGRWWHALPLAILLGLATAAIGHQVETTVNFARNNSVISWLLGGLNFQIEHHLFPRICHVNYPAISSVVEQTCREFGVKYNVHVSVWAGLKSHFRWLRQMGTPDAGREIG